MARKFQSIQEWEIYVPGIDSGAERVAFASDDPEAITVEIRFLRAREQREYDRILEAVRTESDVAGKAREYARRLFCDNVRNIRNYEPFGTPITTPDDLWDNGETDLINDISLAIRSRSSLEAGLGKKLIPPSDISTSQPSRSEGGVVLGATQPSTPMTPEALAQVTKSLDWVTGQKGV